MTTIDQTSEWKALAGHHLAMADTRLSGLFARDAGRARRYSLRCGDLLLDFSRNRITDETMNLLRALAQAADLSGWTERLFRGDSVNTTENRPALHAALRQNGGAVTVAGKDVMPEIAATRRRMYRFADAVRDGTWRLHADTRVTDIVHIGIGGSDLGPRMVVEALRSAPAPVRVRFVSSLDDAELATMLDGLIPASTLFIVASKSFATPETLANANSAKEWLRAALRNEKLLPRHFVAVTARPETARAFGVDPDGIFPIWDWIGGRYSLWSAIGLPIALALGSSVFEQLLAGAREMDVHFRTAKPEENLPATLALLGIWYGNFFGAETQAMLPYDWRLRLLPAWLQQLDMESSGKSVDRDGRPVGYKTGPIIWGGSGSDGQHAFFQLLHQGKRLVPADFIIAAKGGAHRDPLMANFLAQIEALTHGSGSEKDEAPHRVVAGNQPTNTILMRRLDASTLGALLALYEHKVFAQGVIWGINPFDQWGVELGKVIAKRIEPALGDSAVKISDPATAQLIEQYHAWKSR